MDKISKLINRIGGADKRTAQVLGISPSNLSEFKSGKQGIQAYVSFHISLLLDISEAHLQRIIEERVK